MGTINFGGVRFGSKYDSYQKGNSNRREIPKVDGTSPEYEKVTNGPKRVSPWAKYGYGGYENEQKQLDSQYNSGEMSTNEYVKKSTIAAFKDDVVNTIIDMFPDEVWTQEKVDEAMEVINALCDFLYGLAANGVIEDIKNNLSTNKQEPKDLIEKVQRALGEHNDIIYQFFTRTGGNFDSFISGLAAYVDSLKNPEADTKSTKPSSVTLSYPQVLANKGITIHRRS